MKAFTFILLFVLSISTFSQRPESLPRNDEERTGWNFLLNQNEKWYQSEEALRIADNILLLQRSSGGWPKNIDATRHFSIEERVIIESNKDKHDATIDNASTYTHLRYLAKTISTQPHPTYIEAFNNGFAYLIEAQYDNGGWPQFYPLRKGYYSHITYNDDAMTGVLYLLKAIVEDQPDFDFMTNIQKQQASTALEKGIDVVLKTQVTINGKATGWCAQYDEFTLLPADARSYELASISGKETITLLEFLMTIENPSDKVAKAILSAATWFEKVKITGKRLKYIHDSTAAEGFNRILIDDPDGNDLWARFYNLKTEKPLWVDRGGIVKENYNDISAERRNNYAYVEQFAHKFLYEELPEWKKSRLKKE